MYRLLGLLLVVVASLCMIACRPETLGLRDGSHKYQIYNEGFRTWELDLVMGQKCILLTTEDDLKKPETKM